MAKENPWFKFEPAEWMFGRIQRQTPELKGVFIDLICKYWHRQCEMSVLDAELDFGKENIDVLFSKGIIHNNNDESYISISFLYEQMDGIKKTSEKNSKSGKASAAKRKALAEQKRTTVKPPLNDRSTDKIRGDKKIEEEIIFNFKNSLLSYGFKKELVTQWLNVRKKKRLTNSEVAYNAFIRVIEKASVVDKNVILEKCVEKSWGGLEYDWLVNAGMIKSGGDKPFKYEF